MSRRERKREGLRELAVRRATTGLDPADEARLFERADFDPTDYERAAAAIHLAWLAPADLEPLPEAIARRIAADARAFLPPGGA